MAKIPAPAGNPDAPLKALIFDSIYDSYKGAIVFCRMVDGKSPQRHNHPYDGHWICGRSCGSWYFGAGQFIPCEELTAGMVGYITASIKNVRDTRVGDTITDTMPLRGGFAWI